MAWAGPPQALTDGHRGRGTALHDSEQFFLAAYEAYEQLIRLPWSPEPQPTPVLYALNLSSSLKRGDVYWKMAGWLSRRVFE